jgi:hypothetical protein
MENLANHLNTPAGAFLNDKMGGSFHVGSPLKSTIAVYRGMVGCSGTSNFSFFWFLNVGIFDNVNEADFHFDRFGKKYEIRDQ